MNVGLLTDIHDNRIVLNYPYFTFANKFGNVKLIHPWEDKVEQIDLLILPGGLDLNPLRYNQIKIPWLTGAQNDNFEYFDQAILPRYIEARIPTVGVCRGHQSLNVHFGGSLKQHISDEPTSTYNRGGLVHDALDVITGKSFKINSLHHQAIDTLGNGIYTTLVGIKRGKKKPDKQLHIEAIRHKELPICGFQFHPEELEWNSDAVLWVRSEIHRIARK